MRKLQLGLLAASALVAAPASAATFVVDAFNNSSSGTGVGLASIVLTVGKAFTVSSSLDDLWSAGALPRWSDANGLTGDRFATGTDESGEAAGTKIGQDFGLWGQNGLDAAYGSLVGEIGGEFRLLGASFAGTAWKTGTLNLYYWDSNNFDNEGAIAFNITAVPEPATWAMLIGGFGLVGASMRRRSRIKVSYA